MYTKGMLRDNRSLNEKAIIRERRGNLRYHSPLSRVPEMLLAAQIKKFSALNGTPEETQSEMREIL